MHSSLITELSPLPSPLEVFSQVSHLPRPILLESANHQHPTGRYSFVAADPVDTFEGSATHWPHFRDTIRSTFNVQRSTFPSLPPFQGGWAGWFAYELGAAFDAMPRAAEDPLGIPDVSLGLYDWVIAWDHAQERAWLISTGIDEHGHPDSTRAAKRTEAVLRALRGSARTKEHQSPPSDSTRVTSDFSAAEYQSAVARVIEYILAGDIFQANLTQRFTAPFAGSAVALYERLRARTQAPMAALLNVDDTWVVSASPERFLRYDSATRAVETRPIKGTRARGGSEAAEIAELLASEKDRAENVMIVDLLRNDLARVCVPGSVQVPSLCAVDSHPTVHHLVSTVTGELATGRDALDLLAAAFPGGSITGAPKLRAMEIIAELEPVTRGVYCGAIGWLGLDGSMDTSIAIRTITCKDGVATINAGGGVTARSNPNDEYQESLDKAAALIAAVQEWT